MFRNAVAPATRGRAGWLVVALMIAMLSASAVHAQQPPAQPAQQAQAQKSPYVFAGDAAVILNFVKADKTADFEMVIGKLKEALAKSEKAERKQQAASWKIYKAAESGPAGSVIYVSTMEPAVKGQDYSVALILSEAFPSEVQALYKTYSECFGQPAQNILNLTLVNDLSK
jgi:hypothetical protein